MNYFKSIGYDPNWRSWKKCFFRLHFALSLISMAAFGYLIMAPLIVEGPLSVLRDMLIALMFKQSHFAWANGTFFIVAILYLIYTLINLLPLGKRWANYRFLADAATLLAVFYANHNSYQLVLVLLPVLPWYLIHRVAGSQLIRRIE
ncbi:MAG: hypothetical protein AB1724_11675 [Thermodesulfobacteriota bacterium]